MRVAFVLSLSLVACSASTAGDGSPIDGGLWPTDDGGPGADGGTGTGKDAAASKDAGTPAVPFCRQTCSTASDCVVASAGAAFDADNYACESGTCAYKGCNDDAECESTFKSTNYVCRAQDGLKSCVKRCAAAADCATPSAAYDADNYACEAGGCRYKGCNTDAECASTTAGTVCRLLAGATMKYCVKSCSTASDCATTSAAYDADNYACEAGLCAYKGCNSDGECQSSMMKPNYACK